MNKNILAGFVLLFSASAAYGTYKVMNPCPKFSLPDCALVSQSNIARDGQPTLNIKATANQNEMSFEITSNVTCPSGASLYISLDKKELPNWPFGDLIEAAYVPAFHVKVVNGSAKVNLTTQNSPSLGLIPSGEYIVDVSYSTAKQSPRHTAFYAEVFGLEPAKIRDKTKLFFRSSLVKPDVYNDYLSSWLRMVNKAQIEGLTKKNLSQFEKEFGKAEVTKQGENTTYVFPDKQHAFITDAEGRVLQAKRYSFEGEGQ